MKAYKCDICGDYTQGLPSGVLYDNRIKDKRQRRQDICEKCMGDLTFVDEDSDISDAEEDA